MYKILRNEKISKSSYLLTIKCPIVIKNAMPGQFIIVMWIGFIVISIVGTLLHFLY